MDTNFQLPGGVEFDNNLDRIFEGILLAAMGPDLDDQGEAHGYESNEEELDLFMPPPGHASAAQDLSPYSDVLARLHAEELDQRIKLERLQRRIERLEEDGRAMRSLFRTIGLEAFVVYGNVGSGRSFLDPAASVVSLETYKYGGACAVSDGGDGCVICIEDFKVGDDLSVVPCEYRHSFHRSCIAKWLARSRFCPLCRHELLPAASV